MKLLSFFAHPDDETMLAGGILAILSKLGVEIHYLSATRGEGGEVGEPPLASQENLGEIRKKELACAVHALGKVGSLQFMGYRDPLVGPDDELFPFMDDPKLLSQQITTIIQDLEIDVLLTHGSNGEYGHPAHILCHQASIDALNLLKKKPALYTVQGMYEAHPKPRLANQSDPAHMILDVKSVLNKKINAALCHKSQNALFVRRASKDLGRPVEVEEVVMEFESLHRVVPELEEGEILKDDISKLLSPFTIN
ncbi:MAG: PIG-L family deacetylase [Chloroflexi bacterium]|jgi:N-acetylglucosamine malate deacetylase 2|nr:PIG-L family deacetylase [Chloroflexota bacterium]MBT3669286.1 PIG-L family deacetylase [Chloroflexota bacterium]MBT4003111.1 PIG-L family deacetylase [Chloroflexota bacterium]MBT4305993.1 PIG-L family deacetylase [Chloroflexota bacterium]MBT4532637.1 PIG-L family deacetylase [Chloroflexota bacterium]